MSAQLTSLTITVDETQRVSGLLLSPSKARACYVLAHGAGAGMQHAFMTAIAEGLAERSIATLRYQFPYMEQGKGRPDSPALAQATVRAAVGAAAGRMAMVSLVAGGKSFGGRMTSQAQASDPLPGVRGLAFLGFPLHTGGKPSDSRAKHLSQVRVPMLFLQGTRDALAELSLIQGVVKQLGPRATLHAVDDADHSFHVRAKSGRKDAQALKELCDVLSDWMLSV